MEIEMTDKSNALKLDYDETSPITGNVCVIVEADENTGAEHRMCMESGFVTRTSLVFNSEACIKHEEGCTELMKKLKLVDKEVNSVWYPTFMQMPGGMLYCDGNGTTPDDYCWKIAKVIEIVGDERLKYPLPGVEGEYYTSKLDVDNALVFSNTEFEEALDKFYTIIQEHNDKD
tara:strand:+ start:2887 stop:3408 length:522 start_codon:yes stop_codon:yes gene_type:complete